MTLIAIPKVLRDKLTDAGADALVEVFDKVAHQAQAATLELAEERLGNRVLQLEAKMDKRTAELDAKIERVSFELNAKIDASSAGTNAKMEKVRADLIQWMFVFWVGQVGTVTAILFAFFKP